LSSAMRPVSLVASATCCAIRRSEALVRLRFELLVATVVGRIREKTGCSGRSASDVTSQSCSPALNVRHKGTSADPVALAATPTRFFKGLGGRGGWHGLGPPAGGGGGGAERPRLPTALRPRMG